MAEVEITGGAWLHSLGRVSAIKWSTAWGTGPSGSSLASCTVAVDQALDVAALGLRQPFDVWSDGVKRFGGYIIEAGQDFPRSLTAAGWGRRAEDFDAVDSTGAPTTNPRTAVTEAIARGLEWSNPAVFDNVSLATDDGSLTTPQRLNALLDSWAVTVGKRWGVDAYGVAFAVADPTSPTWFLDASDLPIGVADDNMFTRVRATYYSAVDVDGNPTTPLTVDADDAAAQALYGVIEYPLDLTSLGMLSGATALGYAQQQLASLTVPRWLSRVTTNAGRLRTAGGLDAHLPSVASGQMVRLFNLPHVLGGLRGELGLDVVLGEVEYDTEDPAEVTIAPVGLAVRTLADQAKVVAQTASVLRQLPTKAPHIGDPAA